MTTHSRSALVAANLLFGLALATPSVASDATTYPRTVGSGENTETEYGPAPRADIVGGGAVHVTAQGDQVELHHLDPSFVQVPPDGQVPVMVGSGENASNVWGPSDAATTVLGLLVQPGAPRG